MPGFPIESRVFLLRRFDPDCHGSVCHFRSDSVQNPVLCFCFTAKYRCSHQAKCKCSNCNCSSNIFHDRLLSKIFVMNAERIISSYDGCFNESKIKRLDVLEHPIDWEFMQLNNNEQAIALYTPE